MDMSDATPVCPGITLSATGAPAKWSNNLGHYVATGEVYQEAPVYKNSEGVYLYRYSDGTWRVDVKIGSYGVYKSVGTGTAGCPASISQWQYWDGISWHSGDISAKCSVHTQ